MYFKGKSPNSRWSWICWVLTHPSRRRISCGCKKYQTGKKKPKRSPLPCARTSADCCSAPACSTLLLHKLDAVARFEERMRSLISPLLSSPRLTQSAVPIWPAIELNGVRLAHCAHPLSARSCSPIGRHGTRGFWQAKSLLWRGPITNTQTQTWTVHAQGGGGTLTYLHRITLAQSNKAGFFLTINRTLTSSPWIQHHWFGPIL